MISINLMGGLGNQLFQIFATISYAIRHRHKFIFAYTETVPTNRITYWNNFLLSLKIFTTANLIHRVSNNDINNMQTYDERVFEYNEIPAKPTDQIFKLYGYFQSYKYFEKEQNQIYSLIRLDKHKESIRNEVSHLLNGPTVISMHFRLGDYKQLQGMHPVMPPVYFRDALSKIIEMGNISNARVIYFNEKEDNEIVHGFINYLDSHFKNNGNCQIEFVKVDDNIPDWKQMLIMSCCHHNIIANSSFSWWGAYLNSNTDKIVCYPSLWFGELMHAIHGHKDTADLFPPNWTKIQM